VSEARRTALELAEDAEVTVEQLAEWESLGILHRCDDGAFDDEALVRARLLRYATRRGLTGEALAAATENQGDVMARSVRFLGAPEGRGRSIEQAADELGLDAALVRRLWIASGFGDETRIFDDDVEELRGLVGARGAGMPDEALLQVARVFGDALSRVADLEIRLFHFYVHEALRSSGLADDEITEMTTASGAFMQGLVEPAILYYHRKAWQRALREDVMLHLAEDVEAAGVAIGELTVAVLFVDVAGYTAMTERLGDTAAAAVLDRFSDLVREAAANHDGRVVKQIGDEFMVVFPDGVAAVRCGLDLSLRANGEADFPELRMGAHAGPVLYRDADYLGATVNLAARVTGEAGPGELVVTDAVRRATDELLGLDWQPLGARALKGLADPVDLHVTSTRDLTGPDQLVE
jgi:class 3 adenylate cyclase